MNDISPPVAVNLVQYPERWAGAAGDQVAAVLSDAAAVWLEADHEGAGLDELADEISQQSARLNMPYVGAGRASDGVGPVERALRIAGLALSYARTVRDLGQEGPEEEWDGDDTEWESDGPLDVQGFLARQIAPAHEDFGDYALDASGDGLERRVFGPLGYRRRLDRLVQQRIGEGQSNG